MPKITTLNQLAFAVKQKKALAFARWGVKSRPAAFVYQLPAVMVHQMMREGLSIYKKPAAPKAGRRFAKPLPF